MRFRYLSWAGAAVVFLAVGPTLAGQTASPPYGVLGPVPTPEQVGRTERLRAILTEGWKVKPADAARMEQELGQHPEDLQLRIRLISYYSQYTIEEARVRHVLWLIENHPDADIFEDGNMITRLSPAAGGVPGNQPADYTRARALWQQQTNRFPRNTKVLANAATALSYGDPEIAVQLVEAARRAEPANAEWTRWLAKVYADAIRWSFWDGNGFMTFTGDAEDYRHYPFPLPSSMRSKVKAEMEASTDTELVGAVGQALVREVQLLHERSAAGQGDSLLTAELPQVAEFGTRLLDRARALQANGSKSPK